MLLRGLRFHFQNKMITSNFCRGECGVVVLPMAPYWLVQYTKYILFDRCSKQKVRGRLLRAKVILTGVDMGRSFSVLLFCIAMDPILHYLNCIPGVLMVQGYVDDTTLSDNFH